MGTRGHLGGLAEAALQALLVLDAAGKDVVFLETVGAGQSEVEVIGIADTVLLVLMPGSGDAVQALKAGIMEIPDVIAINKMDNPAAKTMLNEVRSILALDRSREWNPPIVLTEAVRGEHVPELWEKIEEHRAFLEQSGQLEERRRANLAREVFAVASSRASRHLERAVADDAELRRLLAEVQARELDPLTAVQGDTREGVPDPRWRRRPHPALPEIERARERLDGVARVTPVFPSETLSRLAGRSVHLKAENLQRTGSFKIRGAYVQALEPRARASARPAWSRRAPATTARPSPGRPASSARRRGSSCRRTRRWRRSTRPATTGPRSSSTGLGVRGDARNGRSRYVEETAPRSSIRTRTRS